MISRVAILPLVVASLVKIRRIRISEHLIILHLLSVGDSNGSVLHILRRPFKLTQLVLLR